MNRTVAGVGDDVAWLLCKANEWTFNAYFWLKNHIKFLITHQQWYGRYPGEEKQLLENLPTLVQGKILKERDKQRWITMLEIYLLLIIQVNCKAGKFLLNYWTHSISNGQLDGKNFLSILILNFYPAGVIGLVWIVQFFQNNNIAI